MQSQHCAMDLVDALIRELNLLDSETHAVQLGLFRDWLARYGQFRGFERALCVDFPKIGKAFDKALSDPDYRFYPPEGISVPCLPFGAGRKHPHRKAVGVGVLLAPWLIDVDNDGSRSSRFHVDEDIKPEVVQLLRTILYGFKKLKLQASPDVVDKDRRDFVNLDRDLHEFLGKVPIGRRSGQLVRDFFHEVPRLRGIVERVRPYFIPLQAVNLADVVPRHGPGATADQAAPRDKFNFVRWSTSLESEFPAAQFSRHDELAYNHSPVPIEMAEVAKLCCVPKTLDKTRVITVEPTDLQFIQQGMRRWMIDRSSVALRNCYDGSSQTFSQVAAMEASIDGSTATIDLKSASDRLSLDLVEYLFAPNQDLLAKLKACRSQYVNPGVDSNLLLAKYAGQGNATTFHVQSVVYAILSVAAALYHEGFQPNMVKSRVVKRYSRKVRVYGDDIIMPSRYVSSFALIVSLVGLQINVGKTHFTGHFREACGGDYYKGYEVNPLYFTYVDRASAKTPEKLISLCAVRNNAYHRGYFEVCKVLQGMIPAKFHTFSLPGAVGFDSRFGKPHSPLGHPRWNRDLSRREFPAFSLTLESEEYESDAIFGRLHKYFVEKPSQLDNWQGSLTKDERTNIRRTWIPAKAGARTKS